jgi:hypothetical protein
MLVCSRSRDVLEERRVYPMSVECWFVLGVVMSEKNDVSIPCPWNVGQLVNAINNNVLV